MDAPACDFPELAAGDETGKSQREECKFEASFVQHSMNRDVWVRKGIRQEQSGHDKAHAGEYEQGGTDTPPASSVHLMHPLEETEREKDEQETHDDKISDLYPAARPEKQVADRLPYGRITRPECAINREHQAIEDRS